MAFERNTQETYYESIIKQGYSRRDFMKFATYIAAYMGLETSAVAQVAKSLETTPRIPVIWEHFQECTCCSESFIRSDHPIVADIILDKISLHYTLTLMAASGHQAEAAKHATMEKYKGEYILCVEGSIPMENDAYCCIAGRSAKDILLEAAEGAKAITIADAIQAVGGSAEAVACHVGKLRLQRMCSGCLPQSYQSDTHTQNHQEQAHYQGSGLPAHR